MIFWLALTYCLGQTTTLSFSLIRIDKGVIASREEEFVDPCFALGAFSGRGEEQGVFPGFAGVGMDGDFEEIPGFRAGPLEGPVTGLDPVSASIAGGRVRSADS